MRFSMRKALLGVLVIVVLQLVLYFWGVVEQRLAHVQRPAPSLGNSSCLTHTPPAMIRLSVALIVMSKATTGNSSNTDIAASPLFFRDLDIPSRKMKCPAAKEGMLNVHLISHSHVDVGWRKTADQYYTGELPKLKRNEFLYGPATESVRRILNSTITELLKNPDRTFSFIEMAFLSRYWDEINNTTRKQVKKLIERGQLEIVLGGWVMSDAAVTYYNDIIDQHTLGFDFLHHNLGPCAQSRVAWHVDQFGHSREHAAIFTKMGVDALIIGRIDFQDHEVRKKTKTMEFVWETSTNVDHYAGNLFTHIMFDGYYSPKGYVLDGVGDLFRGSREKRVVDDFISVAQQRAATYRTQHLMMPMGGDFCFQNATTWFTNMDRLIKLVNDRQRTGSKVNLLYSTPSCYVHHVHKANLSWAVKGDDFHPYAISPGAYWTGYFTSRSGQKLLVKYSGATLQACKQLGIFSRLKGAFNRTNSLRQTVAVMQHHDAITGTEKQHVSHDYNHMMCAAILECQSVISDAYNKLLQTSEGAIPLNFSFCPLLNMSQCAPTETQGQVLVLAYNPLSRPVSTWLRLPVTQHSVTVRDAEGQQLPSQLVLVPPGVLRVPERHSDSDTEVVFPARLPAMGYTSFLLTTNPGGQKPMRSNLEKGDIVLENEHLKVTFDGRTGRLKELKNLASGRSAKLSQDIAFYKSVQGPAGSRFSGAYLFVPQKEPPKRVGGEDPISIRLYKGPLVQEVHQQFSSWVSQVVRLYNDSRHLELEWTVGPIPIRDYQGKEVASFFSSDLKSNGTFYTDSNGRETLERRLDHRETWNLTVVDPVSGNYYPVTSRIYIQDKERDIQLTVLPDRSQGGSSLSDGALELMMHRRTLFDDDLGIIEPLNELGIDNDGVVYTGKHLVFLDTIDNSASLTREMALHVHLAPTLTFLPLATDTDHVLPFSTSHSLPQTSFLGESLAPNVQVLTMDYSSDNHSSVYLLRLEHIYERHESQFLSTPATVKLKNLFSPFEVTEVEEVSLGGNLSPRSQQRLKWTTDNHHTNTPSIESPDYKELMQEPFTVTLQPMEIRTFRVYVSEPSSSSPRSSA